jgi:hypothetical protein
MRFFAVVAIVVLPGLLSLVGCSGPPTDGSRLGLPAYGVPDQWEPDIERKAADTSPES